MALRSRAVNPAGVRLMQDLDLAIVANEGPAIPVGASIELTRGRRHRCFAPRIASSMSTGVHPTEDRMLASGGVVYLNSEEAALAYPKLWRDGNTVRVARHRDRERHGRDWQAPPGLERYAYRRAIIAA
jgi:hypothetical protein